VLERLIPADDEEDVEAPSTFVNYYRCPYDGTEWNDLWSCACNDRCPDCRAEIEPYHSDEL
jgi:hypothetical protein